MALTQQFKMCGNPFRIDTYKGCDFGCKYCFASNRGGNYKFDMSVADFSIIENLFNKAFESDKGYKNINIEMLRKKVPLHLGGLSDPFQNREWEYKLTYKLIELSNKYQYPILISTKNANLPQDYWDILNPDIHAFQISLIGYSDEFIRKYELNTPLANERINFMKELHNNGFWVSLRLQPLIDLDEALKVIKECQQYINYITVEHLKISLDNKNRKELLFDLTKTSKENYISTGREYELSTEVKQRNVECIKSITDVKIGCGDNDLHELSGSFNCCGIDTINDNFSNWIKYNSMYINMTNDKDVWYPKCNCQQTFNSTCRKKGYNFKDYVDEYILKKPIEDRF